MARVSVALIGALWSLAGCAPSANSQPNVKAPYVSPTGLGPELWRGAREGMSVAEIKSLFPVARKPEAPDSLNIPDTEELLEADDTLLREQTLLKFYFINGKLSNITIDRKDQLVNIAYIEAVSEKLQKEAKSHRHCNTSERLIYCYWVGGKLTTSLTAVAVLPGPPLSGGVFMLDRMPTDLWCYYNKSKMPEPACFRH